jgi:hypothetical protein
MLRSDVLLSPSLPLQTFPTQDVHLAGERAAHFRRRLAISIGAPSVTALVEQITFVATRERPTKDPEWWVIGMVVDLITGGELLVYFNPTSKAVKVQRPPEIEDIPPTKTTIGVPPRPD